MVYFILYVLISLLFIKHAICRLDGFIFFVMMGSASWLEGLSRVGESYEGFVKNVDDRSSIVQR